MTCSKSVVSYITLGVSDLKKMETFYSGLGFEIHSQSQAADHPFTLYKSGSLILALYPKHLLAKQAACEITESDSNTAMLLSLNVEHKESVAYFLAKAEDLGAYLTRDCFEPVWGGYCGYFKDPEQNLWEIVWHPNFIFTYE